MFLTHRVDITEHISSAENLLEIDFDSALRRGRELEKVHPEYRFICHNGETGRLGVRKAQYHWVRGYCLLLETVTNLTQGWDWGPVLMTAGPWRPVRLEINETRISDLWAQIDVSKDLSLASGKLFARINGCSNRVVFSIRLEAKSSHSTKQRLQLMVLPTSPFHSRIQNCGILMVTELRHFIILQSTFSIANSSWIQYPSEQV